MMCVCACSAYMALMRAKLGLIKLQEDGESQEGSSAGSKSSAAAGPGGAGTDIDSAGDYGLVQSLLGTMASAGADCECVMHSPCHLPHVHVCIYAFIVYTRV